ncbi:ExeA family protein [Sphingomonas oligophenolica]|uniref:General secretion pathway protein GspA n=1 Tax=Sphingomonas oligophenolica TaxID=301154 RepID=A0A502CI27_9SPHN|nr:AAA family ATPase [Sphingomonas oligophenolica]TPG12473.1 general secretion pathway protein GspA [Sphingomonas oligophenolica]
MYEEHFGFTGRPFQLTPDPKFWFETATHRKAMAYLGYGLAQGEGFIVITGDIGAGKTTLMGHLTESLDPAALNVITLVSTAIEAEDLLRIVATALGVDPNGLTKAQLLTVIERGLHAVARTGRRTLLVVDEAQALPVSALEELRMLSNFQAGGHALLQIVLLGQPEFRDRLHGSDRLEQLRQRVIAIHHLDPMEPDEVADYIAHRLSLVGWHGRPDFAADAFAALFQGSDGVPRRLNQLASRVMLHAAVEDLDLIDGRVVRSVLRDLHADLPLLSIDRTPPVAAAVAPEPVADPDTEQAPSDDTRSFVPRTSRWLVVEPDAETPVEPEAFAQEPAVDPQTDDWFAALDAAAAETADEPIDAETAAVTSEADDVDVDEPVATAVPQIEAEAETAVEPETSDAEVPGIDPDRLAALEARIEQQDAALRRVLTLLVDWVEGEGKTPPPGLSAVAREDDYAPIKGAAAWDDAA